MKRILLTFCFVLFGVLISAQSSYEKTLNAKAEKISSAKTIADYEKLFREFSELKKNRDPYRWKAYYYAGLVLYKEGELILNSGNKKADAGNTNSLAEKFTAGSLELQPDNKEINDLLNLIREQRTKFESGKTVK
jgi:hypothetical protein